MLKSEERLSVKRKCELLGVNRSGLYYEKKPPASEDVEVMNEIRDIYIERAFYGYRKIRVELLTRGYQINRKRVQRLMGVIGLKAVYTKKRTTMRDKNHAVYPYLLKGLSIVRADQVWQVDITYLKMRVGYAYLICLIDVYSRRIMGWQLSVFLDTAPCEDALAMALQIAKPDIINSDQGCQFTSKTWCDMLLQNGIAISMDGKGRWADNIYIERFWRTIKYELVYLHRFENVDEARSVIARYIDFYNTKRPHQTLRYKVPDVVYKESKNVNIAEQKIEFSFPLSGVTCNSQFLSEKLS